MMAENNNFYLNFKYGSADNLRDLSKMPVANGTIYVTTDEHSMYVDLNNKRLRMGDVVVYSDIKDLADDRLSWYKNSLAFIADTKTLICYTGTEWAPINDTSSLQTAITALNTNLTALDGRVGANETAITNINTEIGQKSDSNKAVSIWDAIESLSGESSTSLGSLEAAIAKETEDRIAAIEQEAKDRGAAITAVQESIAGLSDTAGKTYETKTDASAKLQEAKGYTDSEITTAKQSLIGASATDTKESPTIEGAKKYADDIVSTLRSSFEATSGALSGRLEDVEAFWHEALRDETDKDVIDTLKEIQEWISEDETGAAQMAAAIGKLEDILAGIGGDEDRYKTVVNYVTDQINSLSVALKAYVDGLADNYDEAGAAAQALADAKAYADGLADDYDEAGAAAQALTDAKAYADSLADDYDKAGTGAASASAALTDAKAYADEVETNAKAYTDEKLMWVAF